MSFAQGEAVPYMSYPYGSDKGRYVFPVRIKAPLGVARRGGYAHRPQAAGAAMLQDGRLSYAARWLCGGGSPDVILLAESGGRRPCQGCADARQPVVYRCFAADGQLLYVGQTIRASVRFADHRRDTPWWPEVARTTVEKFPTVSEALSAELLAIQDEQPLYNVALKQGAA
jgi:hypothetical protein